MVRRSGPSRALPNVDWTDPNLRFVDLTGDGHADVLITERRGLRLASVAGGRGFRSGASGCAKAQDEEKGPQLVFADGTADDLPGRHDRRRPHRPGAHPQRRNLLLAQPGLRTVRPQSHDGQCAALRCTGTVRPPPHSARRHRWFGRGRHCLPRGDGVRLYFNRPATVGAMQTGSPTSRRSTTSRPSGGRPLGNGTACLVWSSPLRERAQRRCVMWT